MRLAKAIRIAHLQLEHLDCLPLKEFKQLSEPWTHSGAFRVENYFCLPFGSCGDMRPSLAQEKLNVRMTGMTKANGL